MENPLIEQYRVAIEEELMKERTDYDKINVLFHQLDTRVAELTEMRFAA